jgi:threonine/homoserine/homoserine lactone efflux protein
MPSWLKWLDIDRYASFSGFGFRVEVTADDTVFSVLGLVAVVLLIYFGIKLINRLL